jgi:Ca-activated chloride channel homolog
VTALYEIIRRPGAHGALGRVYLRWKDAATPTQPALERHYPLSEGVLAANVNALSPNLRFLACVARFAELLKDSPWARDGSYADVLETLRRLPAEFQQRSECQEFKALVAKAQQLSIVKWSK